MSSCIWGLLFFGVFLYPLHTHTLAARYLQEASHSARGKDCCGLDIDPDVVAHLILGLARALYPLVGRREAHLEPLPFPALRRHYVHIEIQIGLADLHEWEGHQSQQRYAQSAVLTVHLQGETDHHRLCTAIVMGEERALEEVKRLLHGHMLCLCTVGQRLAHHLCKPQGPFFVPAANIVCCLVAHAAVHLLSK